MNTSSQSSTHSEKTWIALNDRSVIRISGDDARDFLQGLISMDIAKLAPDRAIYGALLTPQGKFLHEFFIAEKNGVLLMDCGRERRDDLLRRLTMYKLRAKVELTDAEGDYLVAALLGDPGMGDSEGAARPFGDGIAFVDPRLAVMGARAILPVSDAMETLGAAGFVEAEFDTYERHRVGLGVPDGSRDLVVDKSFLLESNFEELNGVDFNKGCYVGQEVTARTKHRGLVKKRVLPMNISGPLPAPGTKVMLGDKEAGTMCSGAGDRGLALMRLERIAEAARTGTPFTAEGSTLSAVTPDWLSLPQEGLQKGKDVS
ncbi:MAG: folate-binding protein YgfZ [Rhodospirillales bacterium]|nr:folate-binding protein YgfZ [Rhodospirillales bacterium]